MHVAVIDIGRPGKNLGWAIRGPSISDQGSDLDACIVALCAALSQTPLALGFEAPLFIPMGQAPQELTKARQGECENGINRPFSAGAGASVLVTGLTVIPYVLAKIRSAGRGIQATLNWKSPMAPGQMLLFEAFVSNQKSNSADRHINDCLLAISAFEACLAANKESSVRVSTSFNLLGAMLLRTGWTDDIGILAQSCLVVKA